MFASETRAASTRKSLRIALAISLALHAAALFFHLLLPTPPGGQDDSRYKVRSPLQARLHQRAQNTASVIPPAPAQKAQPKRRADKNSSSILTSKNGRWLSSRPQPPSSTPQPALSGSELARQALAMARGMGSQFEDGGTDAISTRQEGKGSDVEPLSLQWYFDSFITKLNRSARFVKREPGAKGQRKALVEIIINRDGSLREYRILRAADQQAEISYIQAVVDRAVPFAAFPPDIKQKTDTLSLRICIHPPDEAGSGFGFTRTGGGNC